MPDARTVRLDGQEIEIEPVDPLPGGGARVDVETDDDRKWRVDVTSAGKKDTIVTTWRDGTLADLEEPDWLEEALSRLARVA